jgi:hypothetical protein
MCFYCTATPAHHPARIDLCRLGVVVKSKRCNFVAILQFFESQQFWASPAAHRSRVEGCPECFDDRRYISFSTLLSKTEGMTRRSLFAVDAHPCSLSERDLGSVFCLEATCAQEQVSSERLSTIMSGRFTRPTESTLHKNSAAIRQRS